MDFSVFDRLGRSFVKAVLLVSLLALIAGALGRYSPDLDLLANVRLHFAGIAAFAALALALDYRPVLVLALGTFLTFCALPIVAEQNEGPLTAASHPSLGTDAAAWTILSLNTWHAHKDPAALAEELAAANADILVLTEFGPNKIPELHTLLTAYPYRQDCATEWNCAIAILSRHPFTSGGSTAEGAGPAAAWITFGEGDKTVTVMGVHVAEPLRSTNLHARELADLAGTVKSFKGKLLVAGDFNVTPWSAAFARFGEDSGLKHMGRLLPGFPSGVQGLPQLAIDHMFASPGLRFADVWLGPDVGSDHRPLLAEVHLPAGTELSSLR